MSLKRKVKEGDTLTLTDGVVVLELSVNRARYGSLEAGIEAPPNWKVWHNHLERPEGTRDGIRGRADE